MTTYNDFDPWGMAGNEWGSDTNWSTDSWGNDYGDMMNVGANTTFDNDWGLQNLSQQTMQSPQYTNLNIGDQGGYGGDYFNYEQPNWGAGGAGGNQAMAQLQQQVASGGPVNYAYNLKDSYTPMEQTGPQQETGILNQITSGINSLGGVLGKNKDLLRMLGAGYGSYKQGQAAKMQKEQAAQMMAKFGNPNAAMYAAGHKNYYQNPGEWMNSPYVQVPYQQAAKEYMAKMASQGRTNPNEMAYTQAQMLNDMASKSYNNWMGQSYPWGQENSNLIGPYSNLMNQSNVSKYNQYNDILKELYRMSGIPQEEIGTTQRVDNDNLSAALATVLKGLK